MIYRLLSGILQKSKRSILLLGPRQVGKSTLIESLKPGLTINLADQGQYLEFQADPDLLRKLIDGKNLDSVMIDEIQRIPALTNTIQAIIDKKSGPKFYLTGSSARKLRRGNANLLPGRILTYRLGPVCVAEMDYKVNDEEVLAYGFLPEVVVGSNKRDKEKLLKSYAATYLKEEIQAEALVRELSGFVRFLKTAAESSGQYLDYSKMAKRAKIPRQSAVRHFEILEDTLVVHKLDYDKGCPEADLVKHPRFYMFDVGVLNAILGNFIVSPDRVGAIFEQLFVSQLFACASAKDLDIEVSNFRTRGGVEVDFIVETPSGRHAIELKASSSYIPSDLKGLKEVTKYSAKNLSLFLAYRGTRELKDGRIWILPWTKVLREIGL